MGDKIQTRPKVPTRKDYPFDEDFDWAWDIYYTTCSKCGGEIDGKWQADHVMAHSGGGQHSIDNYLPAHRLCNNYRWDYTAEEFQYILKIGVWTRTQIEHGTKFGRDVAARFLAHESARRKRRKQ